MAAATAEKREGVQVQTFTVELGDSKNRNINIPILHDVFRGRFAMGNLRGREIGYPMQGLPDIPGVHLTIDARNRRVIVEDPLNDRKDIADQVAEVLRKRGKITAEGRIKGIQKRTITLDEHQMKTLVRFVVKTLLESDEPKATLVSGRVPERSEIDSLPGRYLYDPGTETPGNGPKFEDEAQEFFDRVNRLSV